MSYAMTKDEQLNAAREFAHRVIQAMWDGGDVDGGDIQDWARELGLIYSRTATKADVDEFSHFDVGDDMFEFEKWMQIPDPPDGLPYR